MATAKPTRAPIQSPGTNDVPSSNYNFSGFRGNNLTTQMCQADKTGKPFVSVKTTGNVYVQANQQVQEICVDYIHSTTNMTDYANDVEEHIQGQKDVRINGNSQLDVNSNQVDLIAASHTINVGGSIHQIIGGDRTVEIATDQNLTVSGQITETVEGNEIRNVGGPSKKTGNSKNDETYLGGFIKTTVSHERKITLGLKVARALAFEASATASAAAKIVLGGTKVITVAVKHVKSCALETELGFAGKFEKAPINKLKTNEKNETIAPMSTCSAQIKVNKKSTTKNTSALTMEGV